MPMPSSSAVQARMLTAGLSCPQQQSWQCSYQTVRYPLLLLTFKHSASALHDLNVEQAWHQLLQEITAVWGALGNSTICKQSLPFEYQKKGNALAVGTQKCSRTLLALQWGGCLLLVQASSFMLQHGCSIPHVLVSRQQAFKTDHDDCRS